MTTSTTTKYTAEQLLAEMLRAFEDLSDQQRAVAADESQGDEISRATARGAAGAYNAVVVTVRKRMADLAGVSEAEQCRALLVEIGALLVKAGYGDPTAVQRLMLIVAPYLPVLEQLPPVDPKQFQ